METKRASPKLASHAPNVKRTINKNVLIWEGDETQKINIRVRDKIIPSNARRDINRWVRWRIRVSIVISVIIKRIKEVDIAKRGDSPMVGLQDRCLLLAFLAIQETRCAPVMDTQNPYFI